MGKLHYISPMSLDGHLGRDEYDWSDPSADGHAFFSELLRPIGIYLYGRKTYETMAVWETPEVLGSDESTLEFSRVWRAAQKIVYSRSLSSVATPKTQLRREWDLSEIQRLKGADTDISIGGPMLAAEAIRANLVDEYHFIVVPTILGRGFSIFPQGSQVKLELVATRTFGGGWVYLRYRPQAV